MKGIYKFTNNITKKSYIGQSINLESRYNSHKRNYLNKNLSTYNSKFYRAIRKYGFENFTYEILCQSKNYTVEELNYYEQLYIKQYNSFLDGYNMNYGGDATGGNYFIPQDIILLIKEELKNNPEKSMTQIQKDFKISSISIISNINSGKSYNFIGTYTYSIRSFGEIKKLYQGGSNGNAILKDKDVINIRLRFIKETLSQIYEDYKEILSFSELKKIVYGVHFQHLPIYKKRKRKWYLNGTCIDYPYNEE